MAEIGLGEGLQPAQNDQTTASTIQAAARSNARGCCRELVVLDNMERLLANKNRCSLSGRRFDSILDDTDLINSDSQHDSKLKPDPKIDPDELQAPSSAKTLIRVMGFLLAALAIPAIPFALFGWWLEPRLESLVQSNWFIDHPVASAGLIVSSLGLDILLPIPSSAVCTFSGNVLGATIGTLVNWIGLNVSAVFGYFLGGRFGWPVVKRFCSAETLGQMEKIINRFGLWSVVICRAVPLFAEATVLMAGVYRQSSVAFWGATVAANLGIAVAFAVLGQFASAHGWFSLAMAISVSIPVALLLLGWRRLKRRE